MDQFTVKSVLESQLIDPDLFKSYESQDDDQFYQDSVQFIEKALNRIEEKGIQSYPAWCVAAALTQSISTLDNNVLDSQLEDIANFAQKILAFFAKPNKNDPTLQSRLVSGV